jgi:hypothetical protein
MPAPRPIGSSRSGRAPRRSCSWPIVCLSIDQTARIRCGYKTYATDIVDRGYQHFDRTLNFLLCERALGNNIVTNPTRVPRDPRDRADPFPSPRGRPPRRSAALATSTYINR